MPSLKVADLLVPSISTLRATALPQLSGGLEMSCVSSLRGFQSLLWTLCHIVRNLKEKKMHSLCCSHLYLDGKHSLKCQAEKLFF